MTDTINGFQIVEPEQDFTETKPEVYTDTSTTIDPEFELEIRRFIRACWNYGLKDDWIESLSPRSNTTLAGMIGMPRSAVVTLMQDELAAIAETVERDHDLELMRVGKL